MFHIWPVSHHVQEFVQLNCSILVLVHLNRYMKKYQIMPFEHRMLKTKKNRPNLSNHPFQLLLCWQMSKPHHHRPKLLLLLMTAKQLMLTGKKMFVKKIILQCWHLSSDCSISVNIKLKEGFSHLVHLHKWFGSPQQLLQFQKIVTNAACKHRNSFTCASDSSTPAITLSLKAIETQSCLHQYWCD